MMHIRTRDTFRSTSDNPRTQDATFLEKCIFYPGVLFEIAVIIYFEKKNTSYLLTCQIQVFLLANQALELSNRGRMFAPEKKSLIYRPPKHCQLTITNIWGQSLVEIHCCSNKATDEF